MHTMETMQGNYSHMMSPQLVTTLQNCENTCEYMVTHLLHQKDAYARSTQIQFLRDCADICSLTAKFVARKSYFAKSMANLCAYICEVCGNECLKYCDEASQKCAHICLQCAHECKAFAMT